MRLSSLLAALFVTFAVIPAGAEAGASSLETASALEQTSSVAGGNRAGKSFTRTGRAVVKEKNAAENDGKNRCENCGVETVPGKKHEKGVTPPPNEAHVDHVIPKVKGGPGEPDNGQVLCRECNLDKGDKAP